MLHKYKRVPEAHIWKQTAKGCEVTPMLCKHKLAQSLPPIIIAVEKPWMDSQP